jgi:hypothetical protein
MHCNIISHWLKVPTSLELIENWEQVARLVVEEAFDDFLAPYFAKDIQYVANCMRKRNRALLRCLTRRARQGFQIGSNERRYKGLEMGIQNLGVFLKRLDLEEVNMSGF